VVEKQLKPVFANHFSSFLQISFMPNLINLESCHHPFCKTLPKGSVWKKGYQDIWN